MLNLLLMLITLTALTSCIPHGEDVRSRTSFNKGWKFDRFGPMPDKSKRPEPKGVEAVSFDDSKWRKLDLPHDWGIEGPFRMDLPGKTGKLPWRGIGWYRKTFTVPESDKGKCFFLDIDGAMANAEVFLNGKKVGAWPYGYASFRVDLSDHIKFGQKNILAVRLDACKWDSRWYPGAGIYRNVWLVKTAPVHISHWGVYITTPEITDKQGKVKLQVSVDNDFKKQVTAEVQTVIYKIDKNDKKIAKVATSSPVKIAIPADKSAISDLSVTVPSPKLWSIEHPNRYLAETLISVNGEKIDKLETAFGFRTLKFTAYNGFYLNGKRVTVKGVCIHHDLGPIGTAVNIRARERQLKMFKEMGCNAIRTAHNPPEPELLDLCDKMGFLVMDETFDCWHKGKGQKDYNLLFKDWYIKDTEAMIRRDRNHPCVFLWSSGNEIPWRASNEGLKYSKIMTGIFHKLDPTRPVINCCNGATGIMKTKFPTTVDIYGFNYAIGGYSQFHTCANGQNKNQPYIASETACTASSRGEYFFPVTKKSHESAWTSKARADFQVSSYDVQVPGWGNTPDEEFTALDKNPECPGEFVWTGFDYLGEPTPYTRDVTNVLNFTDPKKIAEMKKKLKEVGKIKPPSRSSYFGIIDLCGLKKDRFYIYQARWRPNMPMAHILPHWNWPERVGKVTPVHVYTSGDEAELFLNGKSLGRKKKGKYQYRLRWDDVVYQPGTLHVVAYKNGKKWAEDTVKTTGKPAKLAMSVDGKDLKADGKDMAFITVSVQDKDGLVVPRTHNIVKFKIDGPAEIAGIGNGDATNHESFQAPQHKVYNGRCVIYLRSKEGETGKITVTANSKGLKPATVTLIAK